MDEWETLIECNKQREKTRIQKANEINKLAKIKAERARRRQKEAGVIGGMIAGRGRPLEDNRVQQNSAEPYHILPSPTTALGNIADIKVTDEPGNRAEIAAHITQNFRLCCDLCQPI